MERPTNGHANTMWLLGGTLQGGRIAGRQTVLTAPTLYQSRDLPVLNVYRAVLASVFSRIYGISGKTLDRMLPGTMSENLGLL